jgi:hydrogenase maturation protease
MTSGRYDAVILVDAAPRGVVPGTLSVIEPSVENAAVDAADAHNLTPAAVLSWVRAVGGGGDVHVVLIGCEPQCLDESVGLSEPVARAVDGAVALVRELIARPAAV